MYSRKNGEIEGKELPSTWLEQCTTTLNNVYDSQCNKLDLYFESYGYLYTNELVLIISLLSKKSQNAIPTTCFISIDLTEKDKGKDKLNRLVDIAGIFFDEYFSADELEYRSSWTKTTLNKTEIHYKITRENIALSIEADKLLK